MLLEKQWQFIKPIFSEVKGLSQDKVTTILMCNVELSRNILNQRYIRLYVPQAKKSTFICLSVMPKLSKLESFIPENLGITQLNNR